MHCTREIADKLDRVARNTHPVAVEHTGRRVTTPDEGKAGV